MNLRIHDDQICSAWAKRDDYSASNMMAISPCLWKEAQKAKHKFYC